MALEHYKTQVLLLHSQQGVLDQLSSGFNKRYSVHCATSGIEALNTLTVTPVHVIVSAQDLPGMSGLDAIREAKKRSPSTIGILLAGNSNDAGIEALVGDQEIFEVVRGQITADELRELVDSATRGIRLMAIADSANDVAANVDEPVGENIVMETSSSGASIVSDGTGSMAALQLHTHQNTAATGTQSVDVLVLTKDEEFLATIRDSVRGLHEVHHALTPNKAEEFAGSKRVGVLVTDAAMVGPNIEALTSRLRVAVPRLVAVVAGRRDDGEMLMDLINRGQVYRFLLKPVSPGRARLAIEASTRHHLDAAGSAFNSVPLATTTASTPVRESRPARNQQPLSRRDVRTADTPAESVTAAEPPDNFDNAFEDDSKLRDTLSETLAGLKTTMGHSIGMARQTIKARRADNLDLRPEIREIDIPDIDSGLPKLPIVAGIAIALAAGAYFLWQPQVTPTTVVAPQAERVSPQTETAPAVVEQVQAPPATSTASAAPQQDAQSLLEDARFARDSGQLFTPAGNNAVEIYGRAMAESGNDAEIAAEFNDLLNIVFAMVESALLEQRITDAEPALAALGAAAPGNPRLAFLNAQLAQQKYRDLTSRARTAMRDDRHEEAGQLLLQASSLSGANFNELNQLSDELELARSEQRVDEVLTRAGQRIDAGNLISPPNDNARYYYELALNNDPQNAIAEQGLLIVASKLVLEARAAIDDGQLEQAAALLADAQILDPASNELATARRALESARNDQASTAGASRPQTPATTATAAPITATQSQASVANQASAAAAITAAAVAASSEPRVMPAANPPQRTQAPAPDSTANVQRTVSPPSAGSSPEDALLAAASAASVSLANSDVPARSTGTASQAGTVASTPAIAAPVSAPARQAPTAQADNEQRPVAAQATSQEPETISIGSLNRIQYSAPRYPRNAMRRNITGSVDVAFTVARDGSVRDVEIIDSTPGTIFDDAATEAVEKWRFEPVFENGIVVERRSAVRMAFDLQ